MSLEKDPSARLRVAALIAGPLIGGIVFWFTPAAGTAPDGAPIILGVPGRVTAGLACWMATWWLTEAIPVYATALLPLAVLPMTGAQPLDSTASSYAHPLIFLFLGGFILALALERWRLHRRFAFAVLRTVGTAPHRLIAGFMLVSAVLSMWVSNTAATLVMLPIAMSVIGLQDEVFAALATGLGLDPVSVIIPAAIAASCAFMLPVATPPNAIVYGSGVITTPAMARAGIWLNLIGIVLITLVTRISVGMIV